MKNKILILFILFTTNSFLLFSQTGIITYKTTRTSFRKTSRPEMARKIAEEVNRATYKLTYLRNRSFFKKDKIIPLYPFEAKFAAISTSSNKDWHQFGVLTKLALYNFKILNEEYIVDYSSKMKDWQLINKTIVIDGYTCYKAIREEVNITSGKIMKNIAWYTPEIPVPYGPIGNGGLPGLILKLEVNDNFYYLVDKITLNPKKMKELPKIKEGKKITPKEKIKLMRDARKVTPN